MIEKLWNGTITIENKYKVKVQVQVKIAEDGDAEKSSWKGELINPSSKLIEFLINYESGTGENGCLSTDVGDIIPGQPDNYFIGSGSFKPNTLNLR